MKLADGRDTRGPVRVPAHRWAGLRSAPCSFRRRHLVALQPKPPQQLNWSDPHVKKPEREQRSEEAQAEEVIERAGVADGRHACCHISGSRSPKEEGFESLMQSESAWFTSALVWRQISSCRTWSWLPTRKRLWHRQPVRRISLPQPCSRHRAFLRRRLSWLC